MPLSTGTKLGPYEILGSLGAGGMGEVYRAKDTKLDREVAIKVLPDSLAQDPDRLSRFEREAKVLASLNHPNIAQIYGVEERALIMELVPGETLSVLIKPGPLPPETALHYAKQIAEALEAAHEKGIIHRDLKPANVVVTPAGIVKVLDFGLAAVALDATSDAVDPVNSPTLTMKATRAGLIMGTAGYMSPEQASGKPVDKRADIWSFGVVLFEMLTGQRLFDGETISHTLADVLKGPIDFSKLPKETPPPIRELLRRCLDRDVKNRLRDIGEARVVIAKCLADPVGAMQVPQQIPHRAGKTPWIWAAIAAIAMCALAVLAFVHFREVAPEAQVVRFFISPPPGTNFSISTNPRAPAVISPDGRRLVFGAGADGKSQLWIRSLDALTALPLAGTEGAAFPFWSPDSRYVGFFSSDGKLKKIDTSGGPAIALCAASGGRGGTWSHDGVIVFSPSNNGPLLRVSAAGGAASQATSLDPKRKAISHRWPWFLPDGKHFLYVEQNSNVNSGTGASGQATLRVASIDSNGSDSKIVMEAEFNAVFAQGHLLFLREGALMAQPFDLKTLATAADAVPVAEQVQDVTLRRGIYSVSENGVLVYSTGPPDEGAQLAWFDRSGKQIGKLGDPSNQSSVHLSPDRRSASVAIVDPIAQTSDIWLYDLRGGIKTRFTFDPAQERETVWSPDGRTIVFNSNRRGQFDLYRKASSGEGTEELLYADGLAKSPTSFSPDGKLLLYHVLASPKTGDDLWVLPLDGKPGDRKPFAFGQTPFHERHGQFAPDGRWIAYESNESQRIEIYVAPFPGPGGKRQVSTAGGTRPIWRRDGKEIFYRERDGMLMAAEVSSKGPTLEVGAVRVLFGPIANGNGSLYDASADGQSFLVRTVPQRTTSEPLTVVQNWTAGLKK